MTNAFRLDLVAKELDAARGGKPGAFEGLAYLRLLPALISNFSSNENLLAGIPTEIGKCTAVHDAVSRASQSPPITAASLRNAVKRSANSYISRSCSDYTIATPITLKLPEQRIIRLPRSTVVLSSILPPRFAHAVSDARQRTVVARGLDAPQFSWWSRVRVKARSAAEALELAEEDLDALRGIWIWRLTRGRFGVSSGRRRPISPIVTGPLLTAHRPDGAAVDRSGGWVRLGYAEPVQPKAISVDESRRIRLWEQSVRQALGRLAEGYRRDLWRVLQRYAVALDDVDWESAALKLWGLLEALSGTHRHAEVVRRSAAVFADFELQRTRLDHLRMYRNRVAHEGHWSRDAEILVCELKWNVEELVRYHLQDGRRYSAMKEAAEFLDLAPHAHQLRRAVKYFRM